MSGGAHCERFYPSAPISDSDLAVANLVGVMISTGEARFNTDTGAISGMLTRAPNLVASRVEDHDGISFHMTADGVGVFGFDSLTVANGATAKLIGTSAVALVAAHNLLVFGVIDARPMDSSGTLCPVNELGAGPGGGAGGAKGMSGPTPKGALPGSGPGGGGGVDLLIQGDPAGGGGGGHAATGGAGAPGCRMGSVSTGGGKPGAAYRTDFRGGSGGGGGGYADGGGGGGAVQLVAGEVITIGDGKTIAGVNAGGCGGKGSNGPDSGGGGGSGGFIMLEAPIVQFRPKGTLAANGGGGGGGEQLTATEGQPGDLSATLAYGAGSNRYTLLAGNGGAGDMPAGTSAATGCGLSEGRGGGGSTGLIEIVAQNGTPTLSLQAVLSPSIKSGAATTRMADIH